MSRALGTARPASLLQEGQPRSNALRSLSLCRPAVLILASLLAREAPAQERDAGWRTFTVPEFGTQVQFPGALFSVSQGRPKQGTGEWFRTADGRAQFSVYALRNQQSPATYLRANLQVPRESLYYQRVASNFFAISANHQNMIYYSRCNFVRSVSHCIYVIYPRQEKRAWDGIVTRISRTLRPL
jgi:hypothetical protein